MPTQSKRQNCARRRKALALLRAGQSVAAVAQQVGAHPNTVRRWRQRLQDPGRRSCQPRPAPVSPASAVDQMLRAEAPEVLRVLLEVAKGGDVRAAGLIVKLLGDTLTEAPDDTESDAAFSYLEREFQSLPAAVASEMVGLLAKAQVRGAAGTGREDQAASAAGGQPGRLPWDAQDPAPDERPDPV